MTSPPQPSRLRGQGDEQTDHEEAINNFQTGAYRDWPNEAGFEGLTEERGPIEIKVSGMIPSWAIGSLYRTGPGIYTITGTPKGTFRTDHWFDGLAHTHRFDITSDPDDKTKVKVFYSSRRQSEQLAEHIKKTGTMKHMSFGQKRDPCLGLFSKVMGTWQAAMVPRDEQWIGNVSVAILPNPPGLERASGNLIGKGKVSTPAAQRGGHRVPLPKSIWATTDSSLMKQMDPETLEPIGFATQSAFHPSLKGPLSCAHAQRDPINGDIYNFNQDFGRETVYRVFRVSASTGQTDIIAELRGEGVHPAYIHSFFLTQHFVVLCIPSSHVGWGGVKIPWAGNIADAIEPFSESKTMRWFVIDRTQEKRGVVGKFESDAGFFFHSINAFEEEGGERIICDMMEYRTLDVIKKMYCNVILQKDGAAERFWRDENRAKGAMLSLARFSLSLDSSSRGFTPVEKVFSMPAPHAGELPTINPLYATRRHRYVYSLPYQGRSTMMDGIIKTDTQTREVLFWDCPKGHSPGEAIFVPRPGADFKNEEGEDDGVLLSVVLNGFSKTSYLLCLDARTLKELGRAEMDFAIGLGFHGVHVTVTDDGDLPGIERVVGT
ncbi:carotenoid oxygenase [Triangularia verruculosa]|uniref:Carotenoid oxygenase n=1 Tax=Triangularia verruculosa TaxID=2587418 RepID=A0AAN7B0B3_9PEZI|nr:carotenoid oxygenase [Triangularia verruculosa]